jgi:pilus assembly protein CpaF
VPGGSTAPTPAAAVQRAALADLIHRVEALADLSALAEGAPPDEALTTRIERALADASAPLRERSDVDLDALLVDARRELCELGPLTPLFDDEDVGEMQVVRHDYVVALHGSRQVAAELGFSSEAAVGRAIRRLCVAAGKPLTEGETFVERRLPRGARLFAVLPREEDHGHMVVVRKPQRADLSLEDLVRSGTISRAMASLLSQCVAAHANILVAGAAGAGTTTLLGALAGAGSTEDRVVVLQEDDELVFNQPHTVSILLGDKPEERVRAIQAAARIRPDRLVLGAFAGAAAAEMVDAMGNGADGVLAGARAPTLRQAVHRLTADIAATRPGLSPEVTREWLASVFDLAIEVARLRDGRHRVLRVAELSVEGSRIALRDVFTFAVERTAAGGTLEGTFSATGVVPAVLDDIAARGIPVDTSIFRRHARAEAGDGGAQSPRLGNADATPLPRPPTR